MYQLKDQRQVRQEYCRELNFTGSGANLIFCSCLLKYDVSRICYSAI